MTVSDESESVDLAVVRAALRQALGERGHEVASDTLGLRRDLYLIGADDLARALFEFHESAERAVTSMYQGSWTADLPPRFAVIPAAERGAAAVEMLEQIHATPLFFTEAGKTVTFERLDELLAEHLE